MPSQSSSEDPLGCLPVASMNKMESSLSAYCREVVDPRPFQLEANTAWCGGCKCATENIQILHLLATGGNRADSRKCHVENPIDKSRSYTGVKTEEIRKGRILGGVQGYLECIFGDPSLTKNLGKTQKIVRKYKKSVRKTKKKYVFIVFLQFFSVWAPVIAGLFLLKEDVAFEPSQVPKGYSCTSLTLFLTTHYCGKLKN